MMISLYSLLGPPNHASLVAKDALPDGAVDGRLDGVSARVRDTGETEGTGDSGDYVSPVVAWPFAHDGGDEFSEFVQSIILHRRCAGADQLLALGLDNLAPDRRSQVATQGFLDLGAEALVAQDDRNEFQKLRAFHPAPASCRLPECRHHVVGVKRLDGSRAL